MNSAFYTEQIGFADGTLVMQDRLCYNMVPLPISGEEPGAEKLFDDNDQFQKYKYEDSFLEKRDSISYLEWYLVRSGVCG